MKKVYIVTTYTGTALSYLIKNISKVEYAHVSISLNEQLKPMYSFGRLNPKTPIFAGLVQENINEGLYSIRQNTLCRVYSLDVTEHSYGLIEEEINNMWSIRDEYSYDVSALFRMPLGRAKKETEKYVCSNFVAHVLEKGKINIFDKHAYEIRPNDFLSCEKLTLVYEGLLKEYRVENMANSVLA